MRVLFVHFGAFDCSSAIQTFHFANLLTDIGWDVTVSGQGDPRRVENVGEARFRAIEDADLRRVVREHAAAPDPETIVCAWTPRERVRRDTLEAAAALHAPHVIHLEDNEDFLLSSAMRVPADQLRRLPLSEQDERAVDGLIHPTRYLDFLRGADGVTWITSELDDFNVGGRPSHLARPGIDSGRFAPGLEPPVTREALGLGPEDFVLVYHGTMHYANQKEMLSLYLAVKLLQRDGLSVRLVRLGHSEFGGPDPRGFRALADGVIELGPTPWREIPGYLALADAYVQPGAPDEFNRYRLPSKVPEFLAMGRPVILPDCNIAADLTEGDNVLLLTEGSAQEIAMQVRALYQDPALARRLGSGAREFALSELSWPNNARALSDFYRELIAAQQPPAPGAGDNHPGEVRSGAVPPDAPDPATVKA